MVKNYADRGKNAEAKVKEWLDSKKKRCAEFDYERVYDYRSGLSVVRVGDFLAFYRGRFFCIEVKEIKHDYRLPRKNFDLGQRARLRRRLMAGGASVILVHHSESKKWRMIDLNAFDDGSDKGSWDLTNYPQVDNIGTLLTLLFDGE